MRAALVLGFANCLEDDLRRLEEIVGGRWPGTVVAANDAGWWWPGRLDHFVTLHPENLEGWIRRRGPRADENYRTWTARNHEDRGGHVDCVIEQPLRDGISEGSSGFLALQVGLVVAPKVVLCGIPMDVRPHMAGTTAQGPFTSEKKCEEFRRLWDRHAARLAGKVTSLSGWTRDLFGEPTQEWLHE